MSDDLTPRTQRPLLLVDIDGVLALMGPADAEGSFSAVVAGFPVRVPLATPGRLLRLSEAFQVVWATSWQRDGAEEFGPLVGLPDDLPFLRFHPDLARGHGSYKLPVIQTFVRDRAAAWVDDELGEDVVAWAYGRDQPTLLIHCDPRVGLTELHVEELLAFAVLDKQSGISERVRSQ